MLGVLSGCVCVCWVLGVLSGVLGGCVEWVC